jgi:acetylornithine deacetylase/succinyl-diaminopimelate desuccinylase-like protein
VNDELEVAEAIAHQARALGLHTQLVGDNPRRPNVIISTAPVGPTGLLLVGHLDTVPPGDAANWLYPPFSGTVADGRLYGRGAIDTKGGMTAALFALAALAATPGSLQAGRAQLICVPDEESGATGTLGIKMLQRAGLLQALGAIYAYSGDQIILGHRGVLRYALTCLGQAAHTGFAGWQDGRMGANAVTGMARLLLALEAIPTAYSSTKYFEQFKTVITPGTLISGGVSVNIVPDRCEAMVDIRLTPDYDQARIEALIGQSITEVTRPGLQFSYHLLNHVPAAISDEKAPLFAILDEVIPLIRGRRPDRIVAGPANEGYLLIEHGIPTVCGMGPMGENAHAANEYVEIASLGDAAAIFALTAHRLSAARH